MAQLIEITVGGTPFVWERLGLKVQQSEIELSDVAIHIHGGAAGFLSCSFALSGTDAHAFSIDSMDGLPVRLCTSDEAHASEVSTIEASAISGVHVIGVDHLVITTDDLMRTSNDIERVLGVACARTRDAGHGVTQAFHKIDNTILELVTGPHVKHEGAKWWGFVLTVDDIDRWWNAVGEEAASQPRDAVQQGRRIATVHSSVGLGVPVAVMSPHVRVK